MIGGGAMTVGGAAGAGGADATVGVAGGLLGGVGWEQADASIARMMTGMNFGYTAHSRFDIAFGEAPPPPPGSPAGH
jgi:hypothetical protein